LAALQVLNSSAVVLLTACWEAFVEDLALASFDWLLAECTDARIFPKKVRARASAALRDDKNELAVWALAGDGWRSVLAQHRDELVNSTVGTFHTPKAQQVDSLYESLIGLPRLSAEWRWASMPPDKARRKLDRLVTIRGNIAHRVRHVKLVRRPEVDDLVAFVNRLAICSHNGVVKHLVGVVEKSPWPLSEYTPHDRRMAWERRENPRGLP